MYQIVNLFFLNGRIFLGMATVSCECVGGGGGASIVHEDRGHLAASTHFLTHQFHFKILDKDVLRF